MSRFYADISGSRGPASRQGSEKSGMNGHVRGWDIGASVRMIVDDDGEDIVSVFLTGGSNGEVPGRVIFVGKKVPEMPLYDMIYRALDMAEAIKKGVICTTPQQLKEILEQTGYY